MTVPCISCKATIDLHFNSCPMCGEQITPFLREYLTKPLGGTYELVSKLGRGGMGEVYKARHIFLQSDCVVKVMRPNLTSDPGLGERFVREARVARKIQHANVATMYEFSRLPDDSYYMVWEFIDGKNLGELVRSRGRLPIAQIVDISIQALEGLHAIHTAGFVHRDVSPDNVMVAFENDRQVAKVIDLGIAKQETESGETQTGTGMFVGKLKYASPEQLGRLAKGERLDGRSDIYSFGIVMYEMLTGRAPFVSSTPHQMLMMQFTEPPPPLSDEQIRFQAGAAELDAVIRRALQKDRSERFRSAREFVSALESLQRPSSTSVTARLTGVTSSAEEGDTKGPSAEVSGATTGARRVSGRTGLAKPAIAFAAVTFAMLGAGASMWLKSSEQNSSVMAVGPENVVAAALPAATATAIPIDPAPQASESNGPPHERKKESSASRASSPAPPKWRPVVNVESPVYFLDNPAIYPPRLIRGFALPKYPPGTLEFGVGGDVTIEGVVNREGELTAVRVARPAGFGFDDEAIAAVGKWQFAPAMFNGDPVDAGLAVTIRFSAEALDTR